MFTIFRFGSGKLSKHLYKSLQFAYIYVHNVEVIVEEDLLPSLVNFELLLALGIHLVKKYGIQFFLKFSL